MKRRWPQLRDAEPQKPISTEWEKVCSEVISAFSAVEVHAEVTGRTLKATSSEAISERIRAYLPCAMQIFETVHGPSDECRQCRRSAILFVAAQAESAAAGKPMEALMRSGQNVLDWYLSTVS
jgi:hypothetical protein